MRRGIWWLERSYAKRCLERAKQMTLELVLRCVIASCQWHSQLKLCLVSFCLGHGDQRHAVHCDRVCEEWRNVW